MEGDIVYIIYLSTYLFYHSLIRGRFCPRVKKKKTGDLNFFSGPSFHWNGHYLYLCLYLHDKITDKNITREIWNFIAPQKENPTNKLINKRHLSFDNIQGQECAIYVKGLILNFTTFLQLGYSSNCSARLSCGKSLFAIPLGWCNNNNNKYQRGFPEGVRQYNFTLQI